MIMEGDPKMSDFVFDHVHLMSVDPAKTAKFYQENFGATPAGELDLGAGRVILKLQLGGVLVLVSKAADASQNGLAHFGLRTGNLNKSVSELKNKGVKFTREVTQVTPQLKVSFLTAPDNVSIEVVEGTL